jgi:hypothetical protein
MPHRPRAGSMINHRTLTAAMIDSRDFIAARKLADAELLAPAGPRIAFTGGTDGNDVDAIWTALDKVHAKHPDMVLLHGGSPRGAERIAACWADNRKVPQVAFKPDWTRHKNAAPFKRNDRMLEALPIGIVAFPGSGVSANLADKAKSSASPRGASTSRRSQETAPHRRRSLTRCRLPPAQWQLRAGSSRRHPSGEAAQYHAACLLSGP